MGHSNPYSRKDRNSRDLVEAEEIKRWKGYTEELYKKDLDESDNHDGGVVSNPDILDYEVKREALLSYEAHPMKLLDVIEFK